MSVSPTPPQLNEQIRNAVFAIYPAITANLDYSGTATVSRVGVNHWTTYISALRAVRDEPGEGEASAECTVTCVYHGEPVASGNSTAEKNAQLVLTTAVFEFMQRPHLQSTDIPNGVDAIDQYGITEVNGVINVAQAEHKYFEAVITLTLPLLFQVEILEF